MVVIIGIFFILHGLVHLLYLGHGLHYFELEKEFVWPDNSVLLKNIFSLQQKRLIAAVWCVLAALGFALSGICMLLDFISCNTIIISVAATSSILFVVFWDGHLKKLHTQGGIALIINLAILVYYLF